jgi:GLPGLI family protein
MKKTIIAIALLISIPALAQKRSGNVQYKYTIFWAEIYANLPFLSQEEKDRELLTWGNPEGYSNKMKLTFNGNESLYEVDNSEDVAGDYSGRNDFLIYRNFKEKTILEFLGTLGKTYLIKDELKMPKWRVMNELKEIQGHMCMKAVTQDTVKNHEVIAWFAADIPVSAGPETYFGLPGLILGLEINNGLVLMEAEKLELKDGPLTVTLPKKMKGKEIDLSTYNNMVQEHIKNSIGSRRNPYWSMRY